MFQFTNETNGKIYLAFGYWDRTEDDWISEGWWTIQPGCTIIPYAKQLLNRYYYYYAYYARNSGYSGKWSGSVPFYVKTDAFEIKEKDGNFFMRKEKFRKIDVGNSATYLLRLTSSSLTDDEEKLIKTLREYKH